MESRYFVPPVLLFILLLLPDRCSTDNVVNVALHKPTKQSTIEGAGLMILALVCNQVMGESNVEEHPDGMAQRTIKGNVSLKDVPPVCPKNWLHFVPTTKCLFVSTNKTVKWNVAVAECNTFNATLAIPHNKHEHDFISKMLSGDKTQSYWIGPVRRDKTSRIDKSYVQPDGKELTFSYWMKGKPKGAMNYDVAVAMSWDGDNSSSWRWIDGPSTMSRLYICESDSDLCINKGCEQDCRMEYGESKCYCQQGFVQIDEVKCKAKKAKQKARKNAAGAMMTMAVIVPIVLLIVGLLIFIFVVKRKTKSAEQLEPVEASKKEEEAVDEGNNLNMAEQLNNELENKAGADGIVSELEGSQKE